ncbi:hypothetical protein PBT90_00095 [Algoriphagus halophytocola]|uniref:hypothetical protein n=1 Tax=Algoriphagus halophytocola TaxID=2991499 RepID=UPI0022DD0073|nr:hypothetical protein [Algoriphagus sp. TR-M9]WBL42355.1 hypothetical protein PBT90_16590 [Algoriphagus sp. TR-M9]WBL43108.1 hypothetical protein PBT90_00095 [Algoriphagus sp. TR-M9]
MLFWKSRRDPDKYCITIGHRALMITHKKDEFKLIQRPLDASYAADIKSRYLPDELTDYPLIHGFINLIKPWDPSSILSSSVSPGDN